MLVQGPNSKTNYTYLKKYSIKVSSDEWHTRIVTKLCKVGS